mgnify:CR=1 FL=1
MQMHGYAMHFPPHLSAVLHRVSPGKEEAAARDVGPPSAVSASATRRKRRSEKKALLPTDAIGSEELAPVPCPATELPAEFSDVLGTPEHDLD